MKNLLLSFVFLLSGFSAFAQLGVGTASPDANAMLEVKSTTKGFLPPRLTPTQRTTLAGLLTATQTGMQVVDSATGTPYYWNVNQWKNGVYTGTSPINVNVSTNTISLNPGTANGDLITWNGNNWVNMQPAAVHFTHTIDNRQPYLALNYCIALTGVFPTQNGYDNFLGEVCIYGFSFAPYGWAQCNGQLLSIAQNAALFSLLGTYYGGTGITTFALPDLRGRTPIHVGQGAGLSNYTQGTSGGSESATVTQ